MIKNFAHQIFCSEINLIIEILSIKYFVLKLHLITNFVHQIFCSEITFDNQKFCSSNILFRNYI